MRPKTLMLLAVAGGCGLVAMLGVQQAMQGNQPQSKAQTTRVLVALTDIESGVKLTEENVTFKELPTETLPDDPVINSDQFRDRAAKIPLLAGDIIRISKLGERGAVGKSMQIPPGMRVITIEVNDTHTASGLLQPGDRVDVLVTYRGKDERGGQVTKTKTLLEYVEVFATDDRMISKAADGSETGKAKNASLLVTPEQAHYVTVAMNKGHLSLLWRNRADDEIVHTKSIDEDLFEELQGTAGINEARQLYAQGSPFGPVDPADKVPVPPPAPEPEPHPATATNFLNSLETKTPAEPQLAAATPEKPKWVVQVYTGNQPTAHEFELAEEMAVAPTSEGGSLTDMMKQLWNGGADRD